MPTQAPILAIDLSAPDSAASGLRVFAGIADLWGLTEAEQMTLLGVRDDSFAGWKADRLLKGLDGETIERLSYLFGIYAALQQLLPIANADGWIKRPNPAPLFGGRSALAHMLSGRTSDLRAVRQYLDSQLA